LLAGGGGRVFGRPGDRTGAPAFPPDSYFPRAGTPGRPPGTAGGPQKKTQPSRGGREGGPGPGAGGGDPPIFTVGGGVGDNKKNKN